MKNRITTYIFLLLAGSVAIFYTGCDEVKDATGLQSNTPVFSLDKFELKLIQEMNNQPVGWAYCINVKGNLERSGAYGVARTETDGKIDMSIDKEINIASISKFLTAIAVMQLLEEREMSLDDQIAQWLPQDWEFDDGVVTLTFRDLLTHRSGLNSKNSDFYNTLTFAALKSVIAEGVVKPDKPYEYLNANYALFRIIIPNLWRGLPGAPFIPELDADDAQKFYLQYMQDRVFSPVGISEATCSPEPRDIATLYYNIDDKNSGKSGVYYGSWDRIAGGGGYFLTTKEIARVLAYYNNTNILMAKETRDLMKENRLGFDGRLSSFEKHGDYYGKNGSISNGSNQGVIGEIVIFPQNVEVVVMLNSQGAVFSDNNFINRMIYKAYNDSWE